MRRIVIVIAPLLLLLLVACSSDADPTPRPTATSVPLLPSSTVAPVSTSTPVPGSTDAEIKDLVQRFGEDFEAASAEWDTLSSSLNAWRNGLRSCGPLDREADLDGWAVEFQTVVASAISVDFSAAGAEVARATWASSLSTESAGLSALRDTWETDGSAAFTAYEAARTEASTGRQQARAELDAIEDADSEVIDVIKVAVKSAEEDWDAFHERFDEWRSDNGSCDETNVRNRINALANDFDDILASANAIARPSFVRPLAEQFIDAAVTQAQALNTLHATWAPYSDGPWDALGAGTGLADQLRRQVRSSLDELNLQYQVVPAGGS